MNDPITGSLARELEAINKAREVLAQDEAQSIVRQAEREAVGVLSEEEKRIAYRNRPSRYDFITEVDVDFVAGNRDLGGVTFELYGEYEEPMRGDREQPDSPGGWIVYEARWNGGPDVIDSLPDKLMEYLDERANANRDPRGEQGPAGPGGR